MRANFKTFLECNIQNGSVLMYSQTRHQWNETEFPERCPCLHSLLSFNFYVITIIIATIITVVVYELLLLLLSCMLMCAWAQVCAAMELREYVQELLSSFHYGFQGSNSGH